MRSNPKSEGPTQEERELVSLTEKSHVEGEKELRLAIQQAYIDVGKGMAERSLTRANFVTTAAGGIGTLYSGLWALVNKEGHAALGVAGLLPAFFLGSAVALSAAYGAYLGGSASRASFLQRDTDPDIQAERLSVFLCWVSSGMRRYAWALNTAVVCLGLGVALMPLPFLKLDAGQITYVSALSFGTFLAVLLFEIVSTRRRLRGIELPVAKDNMLEPSVLLAPETAYHSSPASKSASRAVRAGRHGTERSQLRPGLVLPPVRAK